MWTISLISGWVVSSLFSVSPHNGNASQLIAIEFKTELMFTDRHQLRWQQTEQWFESDLFKSLLTFMTEHWKQSNRCLGAMSTPCLSLKLFISFLAASWTAPIPYYRSPYTFQLFCRTKCNPFFHIYTNNGHPYMYMFVNVCTVDKHYYLSTLDM